MCGRRDIGKPGIGDTKRQHGHQQGPMAQSGVEKAISAHWISRLGCMPSMDARTLPGQMRVGKVAGGLWQPKHRNEKERRDVCAPLPNWVAPIFQAFDFPAFRRRKSPIPTMPAPNTLIVNGSGTMVGVPPAKMNSCSKPLSRPVMRQSMWSMS